MEIFLVIYLLSVIFRLKMMKNIFFYETIRKKTGKGKESILSHVECENMNSKIRKHLIINRISLLKYAL